MAVLIVIITPRARAWHNNLLMVDTLSGLFSYMLSTCCIQHSS